MHIDRQSCLALSTGKVSRRKVSEVTLMKLEKFQALTRVQ